MGKSKRHRSRHSKKKRVEEELSSSSSEGSDTSEEELTSSNRKRKGSKRPPMIPEEASLDVGNDDLYPAQETRFKDWDTSILVNLEVQRDLGLPQPDKERWDKALDEMIRLRSIYNERRRTEREDIEVPLTSVEKAVQTLIEVGEVGSQVTFEDVREKELNGAGARDPVTFNPTGDQEGAGSSSPSHPSSSGKSFSSEKTNKTGNRSESSDEGESGGSNGVIQTKVEVNEDVGYTPPDPYLTTVFLDDIGDDEEDDGCDQESPSTSKNCRVETHRDSEETPRDGDHTLPNLPTCYMKRRIRVLEGRERCLTEEEFFTTFAENVTILAIAICGPKGMGKTTFLAQMGREIRRAFPERKLFYLEMKKVVDAVKAEGKHVDKGSAIWAALRGLTGESEMGDAIRNPNATELFFDGFDNVEEGDWGLVNEILGCISGSFQSITIRIWIATDLSDFKRIEKAVENAQTYTLDPLDDASQVELIASWLGERTSKIDKPTLLEILKIYVKQLTANDNCALELGNPINCLKIGATCLSEMNSGFSNSSRVYKDSLLDAAKRRSFHTLELILNLTNANINIKDEDENSLLFLSVYGIGNVDCLEKLKFLMEKGANIDHLNYCEENLLHFAAGHVSLECLEFILNLNKFDIDCTTLWKHTPLFLSVRRQSNIDCLEKLKLLIEKNANLNHLYFRSNLLSYAAEHASVEVLEHIINMKKFDINSQDDNGNTPLLLSLNQDKDGGRDCLKKLETIIAHGGKLDHLNKHGENLLLYAARFGSPDVLKYVINLEKFDINCADNYGKTALALAQEYFSKEHTDYKGKIKLLNDKGCTTLYFAKKDKRIAEDENNSLV